MKHTENEIKTIHQAYNTMWELVEQQVRKAYDAFTKGDKNLAREIISREKMVNSQELVVDAHCENFLALFAPVAVDLRFVLSLLQINNNLERIGDFAQSIALFVLYQQTKPLDAELVKRLQLQKMIDTSLKMMELARCSFDSEDSTKANRVLGMDDVIDRANDEVTAIIAEYITAHPEQTKEMLHLLLAIRRIERIGDRLSNIAENVVFYIDAKEIRHKGTFKN
ncbi:Phosphate transport system regulatory protein PhoU [Mucinivorans hirudinis]|uniref:Phosphate-specific transport system accessory protein PhoU n=1 Tax=Mucinivorans hirudinis TaxID=1433126 RepID=A0A060RDL3_9BACT|nr:Phosphate transport system regulatory protein PhoU [Mucinivorans hirudinis]